MGADVPKESKVYGATGANWRQSDKVALRLLMETKEIEHWCLQVPSKQGIQESKEKTW